jgi:hypothetical protein
MPYLIYSDYINRRIEAAPLSQITSNNPGLINLAESEAMQIIKNKLSQKYDIANSFEETNVYNPATTTYQPPNRVYLDAIAYSSTTYALNALTLYTDGNVYVCKTAITVAEAWNASHWTLLGAQYAMFYVIYPYDLFNINNIYNVGDNVFWNGHTYTALIGTIAYDHDSMIQFENSNDVPLSNIFPDDLLQGAKYWKDNGAYTVAAGSLLTTTVWTAGDNRDQQVVGWALDITIHQMYLRKNVPMLAARENQYIVAMADLKDAARGNNITLTLPLIQPDAGKRIRGVTNIKQINSY